MRLGSKVTFSFGFPLQDAKMFLHFCYIWKNLKEKVKECFLGLLTGRKPFYTKEIS